MHDTDPVQTWFSRRRLGLSLHFGLYAIGGWHEQDRLTRFGRPTEACNSVGTQSWGYRKDEDYYWDGMMSRENMRART